MKEPKDHNELIQAFKTLFSDNYFHQHSGITFMPGIDENVCMNLEMSIAHGYDCKSVQLDFEDCEIWRDEKNGVDTAKAVFEPRGAYLIGSAMVGYALAAKERGDWE